MGSDSFTWSDLRALIIHSPPDSALRRKLALDGGWTVDTHLLAAGVDILSLILWSKTEDGQKNRNRPKPIRRPGDPEPQSEKSERDHLVLDIDEYKRRLALPRKSIT